MKALATVAVPLYAARDRLSRAGERTPEPMVMDEAEGVAQFHLAGERINVPIYQLCALSMSRLIPRGGRVFDIGSGSGRYLSHLARRRPDIRITGLDLSEPMLETAREMLEKEGLSDQVEMTQGDMTDFADSVPDHVDAVSCVFALHHLPSPELLAACLGEVAKVRERTGCAVWIFDFARLNSSATFPAFLSVTGVAEQMPPILYRDAVASERAAFSRSEMRSALEAAGLGDLAPAGDRVLRNYQAYWAPARAASASGHGSWQDIPLPAGGRLRLDTELFIRTFGGLPS